MPAQTSARDQWCSLNSNTPNIKYKNKPIINKCIHSSFRKLLIQNSFSFHWLSHHSKWGDDVTLERGWVWSLRKKGHTDNIFMLEYVWLIPRICLWSGTYAGWLLFINTGGRFHHSLYDSGFRKSQYNSKLSDVNDIRV